MPNWFEDHAAALTWIVVASVVLFIATLIAAPALIVRIPEDYFTHARRPPSRWAGRHRALRIALLIGRNVLGVVFILIGILMLALPGQGLLTVLAGLLLLEFPAKYRVEKWAVSSRRVRAAINWLRTRRGRAPLAPPRG